MILHITNWRQRGGGTSVAHLLSAAEMPDSALLYLEDDALPGLVPLDNRRFVCRPYDFRASRALIARMLDESGPLLIHSHGRRPGLHSRLARLLCGSQVRVVHSFHGIASARPPKLWVSAISEMILSGLTDAVVAAGPDELKLFNHLPLGCGRHLAMPSFNPEAVSLNTYGPAKTVGFAARIGWPKLHADLINAVALANRRLDEPLELILAGDGPDASAMATLGRNQLGDRFRMLGHVTDMRTFHGQIDIFAFCSRFEGLPLALIDAMACGLPCVATDVIGCNTLIKHQRNGLLVPEGDVSSLAEALAQLASDDALRKRLGAQAALDAQEGHSPKEFVATYHGIYSQAGYRSAVFPTSRV